MVINGANMLLIIDAKAGKIHTFLTVKKNLKEDFLNWEKFGNASVV